MRIASLLLLLPMVACDPSKKDLDGDGYIGAEDCDDDDAAVNPGAEEVCDGLDNNCDGALDEADASDATFWYGDADGDGYGGNTLTMTACEQPSGYLETDGDCDDLDAGSNPDGIEICDGVDNDCDGLVDGDDDSVDTSTAQVWYGDADGDGYGADDDTVESCSQPAGYAAVGGDCDDNNSNISPESLWYADRDGDGFGDDNTVDASCEGISGYVVVGGDCDDGNAWINPDASEICSGEDEDCDGLVDDDDDSTDPETFTAYYKDSDGDGYGLEGGASAVQCDAPENWVDNELDCDDDAADVSPAETEVCSDGIDNDCSGDAPECGLQGELDTSSADFVLIGTTSYDYFGQSTAVADIDGDGTAEVLVAGYGYDAGGSYSTGGLFVFSGPTTSASASAADVEIYGASSYDYLSYGGIDVADLDQDGYDDVLVGAYGDDDNGTSSGSIFVLYGAASGWSSGASSAHPSLYGNSTYDYLGEALGAAGDVNGDGYPDFTVGSDGDDDNGTSSGSVWVVLGSATRLSGSTNVGSEAVAQWTGANTYEYLGGLGSGGSVGDMDGDGYDELVLTAGDAYSDYGGVFLHYGSATIGSGTLDDADAGFEGSTYYGYFGDTRVVGADLDGDGYDDLVAGGANENNVGAVYVVAGSTTAYSGDYEAETEAWASFAGESYYDYAGHSVDLGDIDGDGSIDVAIGAPYTDPTNYSDGTVYVIYGPLSAGEMDVVDADATLSGIESGSLGLRGSLSLGDVNGDGVDDVVAGEYYGASYYGATHIFYGAGM